MGRSKNWLSMSPVHGPRPEAMGTRWILERAIVLSLGYYHQMRCRLLTLAVVGCCGVNEGRKFRDQAAVTRILAALRDLGFGRIRISTSRSREVRKFMSLSTEKPSS